jgi:hypothetical protein
MDQSAMKWWSDVRGFLYKLPSGQGIKVDDNNDDDDEEEEENLGFLTGGQQEERMNRLFA